MIGRSQIVHYLGRRDVLLWLLIEYFVVEAIDDFRELVNIIFFVRYTPKLEDTAAKFVHFFAWQGKVFDPSKGVLRNKILFFGLNAIIAKVYKGSSWMDKKDCIVLDYSETSLLAHWVRDEIREVAPRTYLGKVYLGKKRLIDFALEFPAAT